MSGNHSSPPDAPEAPADTDSELLLAEAEAEAAEATAAAARARARAARLRHHAAAGAGESADAASGGEAEPAPAESDRATTKIETLAVGAAADDTPVPESDASGGDRASTDTASGNVASAGISDGGASSVKASGVDASGDGASGSAASDDPDLADTGRDDRKRRLRRLPVALPRITRRGAGVAVAAVVLCAGLVSSGYIMWQHHDVTAKQHREAEFVAAARQGVTSLTSLDFNHAADDVKRVLDDSTGTFRDDFQTRADDFAKVIQQSKVATEGHVNSAAVQSMSGDSAVVLVAATSKVTNSAGAKQEPRAWRLSVTVQRVDGQLKMSKVEFVP
ncbi:hypothetical protein NONO_c13830 [Nocardia nova SH22a]|uniref:Uncharacterized protein n=1 Tax=Nocardia nova SH22a TaxID=1415166 RepID=W5TG05_9NOCA|nr:hypothetical protein [Nocardia nova]AHH16186.1 hypothetical protein NONO_c13830 [Nocardia nova SH22a]